MASYLEGFAAWVTEGLGGWSSPDSVTGAAYDAYEESVQIVQSVSDARGWDSSTAMEAYNILSEAYSLSISEDVTDFAGVALASADAETYWKVLLSQWPADAATPGWNELGLTWESYADQARGIYEEALAVFTPTNIDWAKVAKFTAAGGAIGFAGAAATQANSTNGLIGGALVGGLWELVAQTEK
jgi:hypothetical protein